MRSLLRPAAWFLLFALLALPIQAADSAGSLYKKGRDAEARQKYEDAYTFYKQAYDIKPTDLKYRSAVERLRPSTSIPPVSSPSRKSVAPRR